MSEEQVQEQSAGDSLLAQISDDAWDVSEKEWETAGKENAGPIGFKIESAKAGAIQTQKDKRILPTCELELLIVSRPGEKVTPSKMFTRIIVAKDHFGFGQFKSLCTAAGIRSQGKGFNTKEAIKALNGQAAYGTIKHNGDYVNLGNKFAASFEGLKSK
jgi:hypothetical protein